MDPDEGWHKGILGHSACGECVKRLESIHWMHCVNRFGRPVPLESLKDEAPSQDT